jgi:hypothetical protein
LIIKSFFDAHTEPILTYNDPGAQITGPQADLNLGITTFLNGTLVSNIVLETSSTATNTIDYVVTNQNGQTSTTTRTVIVSAPQAANDNQASSTTAANDNTPPLAATGTSATSTSQQSSSWALKWKHDDTAHALVYLILGLGWRGNCATGGPLRLSSRCSIRGLEENNNGGR